MAVATLKITDIDLDSGEVAISCEVEGSKVDDGHMTAAEVMLRVLHAEVSSPAFKARVWSEIEKMTANQPGVEIANDQHNPRKVG